MELFRLGFVMPVALLEAQKVQFDARNDKVNAATFTYWDQA